MTDHIDAAAKTVGLILGLLTLIGIFWRYVVAPQIRQIAEDSREGRAAATRAEQQVSDGAPGEDPTLRALLEQHIAFAGEWKPRMGERMDSVEHRTDALEAAKAEHADRLTALESVWPPFVPKD